MKSEHRHELQENTLSHYADDCLAFLKKYGNHLMVAVCVLSIIASVIIYWQRTSSGRHDQAWDALSEALHPSDYQTIATDAALSKTSAAPWARIQEGDLRLEEGIKLMFTMRSRGTQELQAALAVYNEILGSSAIDPSIRERALFGKARCEETLSNGKLELVVAAYSALIKEFPHGLFAPLAEERLKSLRRADAAEFYAWFSQQKPTTEVPGRKPADKLGGKSGDLSTREETEFNPANLPVLDAPAGDAAPGKSKTGGTTPSAPSKSEAKQPDSAAVPAPKSNAAPEAGKAATPAGSTPAGPALPALPVPASPEKQATPAKSSSAPSAPATKKSP